MLPPGTRIDHYEIIRRAASGATCDVHEARDVITGETVAIKTLRSGWCIADQVVARFLNEAKLLRELRQPHLVQALAWGVVPEGPPYMVLEWLPLDLHRALELAGGRFAPATTRRVAAQLAGALEALHERGIVHRDLKPANVLLAGEDAGNPVAKLADLGLAKRLPDATAPTAGAPISTANNQLLGTWDYIAPEQWVSAKSAGPKADVYALGVLLFQMLAGRLPFVAGEEMHLMYLHVLEPPPMQVLDGSPPALAALAARMLAKKPEARPTMREALNELSDGSSALRHLSI